jgi:peptidoglycan/xylan/chitin deacetylase (PgdA/CDA1 family)
MVVGGALTRSAKGSQSVRRGLVPAHLRGALKRNVSRAIERCRSHLPGAQGGSRTVVLCYHSVAETESDLAIHPHMLREHIAILRELGFKFQNFCTLAAGLQGDHTSSKRVACITFDDGYEDNLTQAAPLLLDLNVPATMFVTSGLMLADRCVRDSFCKLTRCDTKFMSPRQVTELHRAGFEIGAHTHTHPNMARLSLKQTREEVARSKAALEDAIGSPVRTFAYPFGKRRIHYTPMTVRAVREAGFSAAAAWRSAACHTAAPRGYSRCRASSSAAATPRRRFDRRCADTSTGSARSRSMRRAGSRRWSRRRLGTRAYSYCVESGRAAAKRGYQALDSIHLPEYLTDRYRWSLLGRNCGRGRARGPGEWLGWGREDDR